MKLFFIAVAALVVVLVSPFVVETFGGPDLARATVQRAKSFIDLIGQRSPGRRTTGRLVKVKHKAVRLHEQALPKVRMSLPILPLGHSPTLVDIVAPPLTIGTASLDLMPIPQLVDDTPQPLAMIIPQSGPIVLSTETPAPPIVTPPIVTPPIVTPPTEAVPEPATWATLVLGFGLIGMQLRWRRKLGRVAAP